MDEVGVFRKNLLKRRKELGLTQEQLAQRMNVSPQAVSKWENSSYPDGELFPALAKALDTSLDYLFGINDNENVNIQQMIINSIQSIKPEERSDYVINMLYSIICAYNDYNSDTTEYPNKLEKETFAELKSDYEIAVARLNESLRYFCFLEIPKDGVNSYVDASKNMVRLFKMLADEDSIRIICYLGAGVRNRMHSVSVLAERLDIPKEKVQKIIDQLDRFGLVWRVYAELSDEPVILYGFTHSTPLTMILTLAKSLTNYLQFYEPFVDKWHKGAYKVSDLNVTEPVPQISEWEND